jgi:hypothetical protein
LADRSQPDSFGISEWDGRGNGKAARDAVLVTIAPPVEVAVPSWI